MLSSSSAANRSEDHSLVKKREAHFLFSFIAPFVLFLLTGMQIIAWRVCWTSLWSRTPVCSRCFVLVSDPVLFYSHYVSYPKAVQDKPVFSNQGTQIAIFLSKCKPIVQMYFRNPPPQKREFAIIEEVMKVFP